MIEKIISGERCSAGQKAIRQISTCSLKNFSFFESDVVAKGLAVGKHEQLNLFSKTVATANLSA